MTRYLNITARDPLVARDGRPFGAGQGNRMRSAGWPYPSVIAGSFRTALAKECGKNFDDATKQDLLNIEVAGVLPVVDGELMLPAPHDCVVEEESEVWTAHAARPGKMDDGEGGDFHEAGLWPVMLPKEVEEEFKPAEGPAYWPRSRYVDWLTKGSINLHGPGFLKAPLADLRDHVAIEIGTGAAEEGLLFTTAGVAAAALPKFFPGERKGFDRLAEASLTARVDNLPPWATTLKTWHPLGGERRLAHWEMDDKGDAWKCPEDVIAALKKSRTVMMTLATPAIFSKGWKPGWLDGGARPAGVPPLTLVGVCIPRWRAVSGWAYKRKDHDGGPKAIRRMVPAGGVYFFKSEKDDNSELAKAWLRPVSDDEQERRDGFGLAVWGVW